MRANNVISISTLYIKSKIISSKNCAKTAFYNVLERIIIFENNTC